MNVTGTIPEVNLYFAKDSCIVCVNDCIKSELERQQWVLTTYFDFSVLKKMKKKPFFRVSDTPFSRQSSTTSNCSRDSKFQEELSNFDFLTISGRKLPKFQPPEVGNIFMVEVLMTAHPSFFKVKIVTFLHFCFTCRQLTTSNVPPNFVDSTDSIYATMATTNEKFARILQYKSWNHETAYDTSRRSIRMFTCWWLLVSVSHSPLACDLTNWLSMRKLFQSYRWTL